MALMMCILRDQQVIEVPKDCIKDCKYLSTNGQACGAPFVFRPEHGGVPGGKFDPPPGYKEHIPDKLV